jgi:glycyl-tRNA synthetase beta subunit
MENHKEMVKSLSKKHNLMQHNVTNKNENDSHSKSILQSEDNPSVTVEENSLAEDEEEKFYDALDDQDKNTYLLIK